MTDETRWRSCTTWHNRMRMYNRLNQAEKSCTIFTIDDDYVMSPSTFFVSNPQKTRKKGQKTLDATQNPMSDVRPKPKPLLLGETLDAWWRLMILRTALVIDRRPTLSFLSQESRKREIIVEPESDRALHFTCADFILFWMCLTLTRQSRAPRDGMNWHNRRSRKGQKHRAETR